MGPVTHETPPFTPEPVTPSKAAGETAPEVANPPQPTPAPPAQILSGNGVFMETPRAGTAPAPGATEAGDITLNFVNADVREVLPRVLGDVLHLNYVIDPKVQATITVQTSRPLRQQDVLPVLQEVLRASGLTLVASDGIYRLVASEDAPRSGSLPIVVGRAPSNNPAQPYNIQIIPLRYVSATEIQHTIEPFMPKGATMQIDPTRNLLIISGTGVDLTTVTDMVRIFDVDWIAGMSFGIVPLQTASPKSVADQLAAIFGPKGTVPLPGMLSFAPLERMNAILVVSPQRAYVEQARLWIERLDRGENDNQPRIYQYHVQNSRAQDLAKVLTALLQSGQVSTVQAQTAPGSSLLTLGSTGAGSYGGPSLASGAGGMATALPGAGGAGSPGGPSGLGASLNSSSGLTTPNTGSESNTAGTDNTANAGSTGATQNAPGGIQMPAVRIVADEKNNNIVIYARAGEFRMIEDALQKLDVVPLQVLIEATIAEVTLNDNLQYGVQWFFKNNSSSISLSNVSTGAVSAIFPGFNYVLTGGAGPSLVLSALSAVTNVKVISSPQLLVLDNHVASLQVGDEVPIPTAQITQTVTNGAPLVNTIQYLPTGVILHVAPRVNTNGVISLDIAQEVSTVTNTTSSSLNGPTIQQRRLLSSVSVRDGETIALGGLIQDSVTLGNSGLPILSNLPLFGDLFGTKSNQRVRTELLILLSPHVLHNASEARQVTDELRQQMRLVTPLVVAPAPR